MKKIIATLMLLASISNAQEVQQPEVKKEKASYQAFSVGYLLGPKATLDGYIGTAYGNLDYKFKNSLVLGYEWSQFEENSYNNGFAIEYTSLTFDSYSIGDSTGTLSGSLDGSLNILVALYRGKYVWNDFYLPFGVGYSSGSVSGNSAVLTRTAKTGYVLEIGAGFVVNEKIKIELIMKQMRFDLEKASVSGTAITPYPGKLNGTQLNLKYSF